MQDKLIYCGSCQKVGAQEIHLHSKNKLLVPLDVQQLKDDIGNELEEKFNLLRHVYSRTIDIQQSLEGIVQGCEPFVQLVRKLRSVEQINTRNANLCQQQLFQLKDRDESIFSMSHSGQLCVGAAQSSCGQQIFDIINRGELMLRLFCKTYELLQKPKSVCRPGVEYENIFSKYIDGLQKLRLKKPAKNTNEVPPDSKLSPAEATKSSQQKFKKEKYFNLKKYVFNPFADLTDEVSATEGQTPERGLHTIPDASAFTNSLLANCVLHAQQQKNQSHQQQQQNRQDASASKSPPHPYSQSSSQSLKRKGSRAFFMNDAFQRSSDKRLCKPHLPRTGEDLQQQQQQHNLDSEIYFTKSINENSFD